MTKKQKLLSQQILAVLLAFSVLCSAFLLGANALATDNAACFVVSDASAAPGDTVRITVSLSQNPGLVATLIKVNYDKNVLTLTGIENGTVFGAPVFTHSSDYFVEPYIMMWEDSLAAENYTATGTLATLIFEIADSAPTGSIPVTLSVDTGSTYDVSLNDVPFSIQNGSVNVLGPQSTNGVFSVSSTAAYPGGIIQVTISADNNPGIVAVLLKISYDKTLLTLTNVENGTVFGTLAFTQGNDLSAVPYVLMWEDSLSETNYTTTGTLATLTFSVNPNASVGDTIITVKYDEDSTFNTDLDNVPFDVTGGVISIRSSCPGDADEDGAVTLQDVVLITRLLAGGWNVTINETNSDVNRDGEINLKDAVLIRRFLAGGWNVVLR